MKFAEIKDLTLVELSAKGRDLRHEMFNLRLQRAEARGFFQLRARLLQAQVKHFVPEVAAFGDRKSVV